MITETAIPPDPSISQRNQELMRYFERALERNPAANLAALIPESYLQNHPDAQPPSLVTNTAEHNQRTIHELQVFFRHDPEVDLLSVFPQNYARRRGFARQIDGNLAEPKKTEPPTPPDFRRYFNDVETAEIKCNDDIVAKVISTNGNYTEYTALQYLAEQAPEIPAPRPHGLIKFGYFASFSSLIFLP